MDLISDFATQIEKEQEILFKNAVASFGIQIDWGEERKRRFKSFTKEMRDNKTTVYYNDGSINGLRIITFEINMGNIVNPNSTFSNSITFKAY